MNRYSISANGIFWGVLEAATETEAAERAADTWGTPGMLDGIMAEPLPQAIARIAATYKDNDMSIEDAIREKFNREIAEVDMDDGYIWVCDRHEGHFLSNDELTDFIAWVEG